MSNVLPPNKYFCVTANIDFLLIHCTILVCRANMEDKKHKVNSKLRFALPIQLPEGHVAPIAHDHLEYAPV